MKFFEKMYERYGLLILPFCLVTGILAVHYVTLALMYLADHTDGYIFGLFPVVLAYMAIQTYRKGAKE